MPEWRQLRIIFRRLTMSEDPDFKYIIRIANSDVSGEERLAYALTSIRGIGPRISNAIINKLNLDEEIEKPAVFVMVGVNGVGKTTSIAKLARLLLDMELTVILGAADTFRAAAIDQIQIWGQKLGINVIAQAPGSDPGAVAFDTIGAAKSRDIDVVIIDTAGRLQGKSNLMEELKKIAKIAKRESVESSVKIILTIDGTTGQNGLLQAAEFTKFVEPDGIFLSKLDGTSKGGIAVAIADQLKIPIWFIGTGEQLDDIAVFDPELFISGIID